MLRLEAEQARPDGPGHPWDRPRSSQRLDPHGTQPRPRYAESRGTGPFSARGCPWGRMPWRTWVIPLFAHRTARAEPAVFPSS